MKIVTELTQWCTIRKQLTGKTIGFVHTMGHIHLGHLSLCQHSQKENAITAVAIFVNPNQFNNIDDFSSYPRTLEDDQTQLTIQKVDYLLLFTEKEIYSDAYHIRVTETGLSEQLEGRCRLGYFTGMLTVVLKYLNLVQPTRAYYGEKDYQQLILIKKMVEALFLPVEIIGCKTIRAEDGLALSSRNSRLSKNNRQKASYFPYILKQAVNPQEAIEKLTVAGFKVDYIVDQWNRRLAAVWLDDIRLIDNIPIKKHGELELSDQ